MATTIERKLQGGEYATGSTDAYKNERDVIVDILSSAAIETVTIDEINGLLLHQSRAVCMAVVKASAYKRGIKLDASGKVVLDYPATEIERAAIAAMPGR